MSALLLAMSDFLDPGRGPEQSGEFEISPGFFFVLLGVGFVMGLVGHVTKTRFLVGTGIFLIFLATVALPIALHATR